MKRFEFWKCFTCTWLPPHPLVDLDQETNRSCIYPDADKKLYTIVPVLTLTIDSSMYLLNNFGNSYMLRNGS